jgi:hypothetical protein
VFIVCTIYRFLKQLFILAGAVHDAKNNEYEACKTNGRSQLYAACAEYLGIEGLFRTATTAHQYETGNDYHHANGKEDVVLFIECKVVHYDLWNKVLLV